MHTQESSSREFAGYWDLFRCVFVGHTINVMRNQNPVKLLYVLDVNLNIWTEIQLEGDLPQTVGGNSLVLVKDMLLSIGLDNTSRGGPSQNIYGLDLARKSWQRLEAFGDKMAPSQYHAADFWERPNRVLVNSRYGVGIGGPLHNATFSLDPENGRTTKIDTKGTPPSRRNYHSSHFFDAKQLWVICGGDSEDGMRGDLCLLDFKPRTPVWTTLKPFSVGTGLSATTLAITGRSKILIIGGVRHGIARDAVAMYDLDTREVVENGVHKHGELPAASQWTFPRVVQRNDKEFYFIAIDRVGTGRCFRVEIQTS